MARAITEPLLRDGAPVRPYEPADWYWIVAGDETKVWSSAEGAYRAVSNARFRAFFSTGGWATRIASEAELIDVLVRADAGDLAPPMPPVAERLAALARIDRGKAKAAGFTDDELDGRTAVAEDDARLIAAAEAAGLRAESERAALERRLKALEDARGG